MRYFVLLALFALGCAGQTATGTKQTQDPQNLQGSGTNKTQDAKVGNHGAICRCGEQGAGTVDCKAVECAEGLVCGYACGIPGCDSTCMTPQEAEAASTIP